ncbi:MAG: redox-regulated ATPase YchF [bacterium]|nr:redox-regulated ATPase YchF [bacterium]
MRLGILGIPNSGKTTIFNALTKSNYETAAVSSGQFEVHTAVVNVPDERLDRMSAIFKPKKTVYTNVTYVDIGGLDKGMSEGGLKGDVRNVLAQVDGFVHVVRAFENDNVPHPYETINPQRDLDTLDGEFLLDDLITVEKRIGRINDEIRIKGKKVEGLYTDELALLERMKAALEDNTPLRDIDITPDEEKMVRGFGLLSLKPVLVVVNIGDEAKEAAALVQYPHQKSAVVGLRGKLEAELSQLEDPADAEMFMEEYNITELAAPLVIRASYELLAVQVFFTVGEDECRAWRVRIGATAPEAAGAIHTDLQKGFVRAEVMRYEDLLEMGSEAAIKQAGKMRLEGREYIVKDGDILHIRANA